MPGGEPVGIIQGQKKCAMLGSRDLPRHSHGFGLDSKPGLSQETVGEFQVFNFKNRNAKLLEFGLQHPERPVLDLKLQNERIAFQPD